MSMVSIQSQRIALFERSASVSALAQSVFSTPFLKGLDSISFTTICTIDYKSKPGILPVADME